MRSEMNPEPLPLDPADPAQLEELLVAYLDHELDTPASHRVEQLLAAEPKVRELLRQLERSWDALDELGRAEVDPSFTETTLEMVAVAAEEDVREQQAALPRRRLRRWLVGTVCLAAAGAAGFFAVARFLPNANEQLLRDLPVLENLDQYRQVDDVEFLRLLHREQIFAKEAGHES